MATTDRRQPANLTPERVDLGGGVIADLGAHLATLTMPPSAKGFAPSTVIMFPRTRQEANRMSIALKKASRRLQAIGATLPEEGGA